ncbi:MAG TPA: SRPBCC domain-containing protein [Thermoanaerobaculia bacterium]|jgi:uncharacterized protein YndB with AHSA1/START domain|nr:SRPBCC domain-containing protein [Thermoanaerobaculia bacterium]
MSDEKRVIAEVSIDADADAVWRALSEGEEISRWFSPEARVTPGAGGGVWLSWGEGAEWEAPIEIWEPKRHLRTVDPPPSKMAVDYFIESQGGETVLRIVHSGFAADAWEDEIETLNAGWRMFAQNMKHYLERHRGQPRTMASFRHPIVPLTRAEVFPRMLAALGVTLVEEGARFSGPLFEGIAKVVKPPINFSGPLENLGGGFLTIEIEPGRDQCRPAVWVSLYGDAGREAPAIQARIRDAVAAEFGS